MTGRWNKPSPYKGRGRGWNRIREQYAIEDAFREACGGCLEVEIPLCEGCGALETRIGLLWGDNFFTCKPCVDRVHESLNAERDTKASRGLVRKIKEELHNA